METENKDTSPSTTVRTIQTQTTLDPFEGIFYNVKQNDTNTHVTFKSEVLCNIIKTKITADFNQPKDVTLYNISTRVQNVKCLLSLDLDSQELEISGPAHKSWTDLKFRNKMPDFLNKLVGETNSNVIQLSKMADMSDDSMDTTQDESSPAGYMVSEILIDKMCEAISILKSETNMLRLDVNDIRQQRPTYAEVLSMESAPSNKIPQTPGYVLSDVINLSEVRETKQTSNLESAGSKSLSEQPIEVVISNRQISKDVPMPPCNQNITPERPQTVHKVVSNNTHSGKKLLMIGDSILHGVNVKGLKNNVHKHSVSGATINTLIKDIGMYDLTQFHTVILYVGGNDISKTRDIELIEEKYDQLIALIKAGNEHCKVILNKVAPRGDVDVNPLNMIIERLSSHHNTECVDSYSAFHDQNGKLLMRFLNDNDRIHLSRSGTKRLLATINTCTQIVEDYTKCVFPGMPNHLGYQPRGSYRYQHVEQRHHNRCMHCNENNHTTEECRHRAPVTCWGCGRRGHKVDRCWN